LERQFRSSASGRAGGSVGPVALCAAAVGLDAFLLARSTRRQTNWRAYSDRARVGGATCLDGRKKGRRSDDKSGGPYGDGGPERAAAARFVRQAVIQLQVERRG
jgi:hypothetical protein